jgi:hypothetical protein
MSTRLRSALAVSLLAAVAAMGPGSGRAAAAGWTLQRSPLQTTLLGVLAAGPSSTWAFGFGAERWTGAGWRIVPTGRLGPDSDLWSAIPVSPSALVAVGQSPVGGGGHGMIASWDGTRWHRTGVLGAVSGLRAVARVPGTARLWAVGWRARAGASVPLVEHRDASGWRPVALPAAGTGILNGVASVPRATWAVGAADGAALALHRTGGRWTATTVPRSAGVSLLAVTRVPGTRRVLAVGSRTAAGTSHPVAFRWDGRAWHAMAIGGARRGELDGVVSVAPGEAWAVGSVGARPLALHWLRGPAWTRVPVPQPAGSCGVTLHAIAALPGTASMWAVGDDGCGLAAIVHHG